MKSLTQIPSRAMGQSIVRPVLIALSLVVLLNFSELTAQKHKVDAVYLTNGEIFRGRIVESLNPDMLSIETLCLNKRLFSRDEISRIEKENINIQAFRYGRESSIRGYFNHTDMGVLIGSGNNTNNVIFSLQMVNGYKFGGKFYPGIGTGIEFYDHAVVPVFADFSYALTDNRVSPFLRASFGYSIPLEDSEEQWGTRIENKGGFLYAAGVGTSIRTGSSSALTISLVYRFQSLRSVYTENWNNDVQNLERQLNRIALRIGFIFD